MTQACDPQFPRPHYHGPCIPARRQLTIAAYERCSPGSAVLHYPPNQAVLEAMHISDRKFANPRRGKLTRKGPVAMLSKAKTEEQRRGRTAAGALSEDGPMPVDGLQRADRDHVGKNG
jgi:hypothetical protein